MNFKTTVEREKEEQVVPFTYELRKRATYVKGNQYPEGTEEHKAYESGFSDALAMVYIDLTGTPKSKGMLDALIEQAMNRAAMAVVEELEELIEEHDPRGADANPMYWGKALRRDLQTLKASLTTSKTPS